MLRTILDHALMRSLVVLSGLLAISQPLLGQGSAGGFGNFGLGSSSGFGGIGGNTGTATGQAAMGGLGGSGLTGGLGSMGGMSGTGGIGATGAQTGGLGGASALGSSFDPGFGTAQMASGLATAAAVSRVTSSLGGGFGGGFGGGGRGGFGGGGRGGFGGGGRGGFGGQNNQNTQSESKVRAVLRIGFPIEGRSSTATEQMVSARFAQMPLPPSVANVQITMEGRVAVLRGQIAAPEDGKLVENLLSLEPGIDGVRNELVVARVAEEVPAPLPAR